MVSRGRDWDAGGHRPPRNRCGDCGCPLTNKVTSQSRDGLGVTAPLPKNIVPFAVLLLKNLLMVFFFKGCFSRLFQEGKPLIKANSGKRPINWQEKNWEHSGREGIRKNLCSPRIQVISAIKLATFSLNSGLRVHYKPYFRSVPSTSFT